MKAQLGLAGLLAALVVSGVPGASWAGWGSAFTAGFRPAYAPDGVPAEARAKEAGAASGDSVFKLTCSYSGYGGYSGYAPSCCYSGYAPSYGYSDYAPSYGYSGYYAPSYGYSGYYAPSYGYSGYGYSGYGGYNPGGLGGPYSGLGVRPGVGFGGFGLRR